MHVTPEMIVTILLPMLFASQGLWSYILFKAQQRDRRHDLRERADLAILHDLVYKYTQKAIHRGYTTFTEFDNTTALYNIYKEYGGNGTGEELYNEFCKLPKRYEMESKNENYKRNDSDL